MIAYQGLILKMIQKNIIAIQLMVAFLCVAGSFDGDFFSFKYIAIMMVSMINSMVLGIYWRYLVWQADNDLKMFEISFLHSQPLLTSFVPKIKQSFASKNDELLTSIVGKNYFLPTYFVFGLMGAWGLFGLHFNLDAMSSGVYGASLKIPIGRAVFSTFSSYFLVYGFSVFFLGLFSVTFKGISK